MRSIPSPNWLFLSLLSLLSACPDAPIGPRFVGAGAKQPKHGGTLMLSEESKVRSLDPHLGFDELSGVLIEMIFDSLYSYDQNMRLVPSLAERMPELSSDGLTFRIPLRHGVRFHHGREMTSDDVVWSLERMLDPELNSGAVPYYTSIAGVEDFRQKRAPHVRGLSAPDRYTVLFTLSKPDQSFIHKLAMRFTSVIPKEVVQSRGKQFAARPVGTGPFVLESWERGVRLTLKRNPNYHRSGLPYLDGIVFDEEIKRETAFLRFRNGELDVIPRMAPADKALLETPPWKPYAELSPRGDVLGWIMNTEMPPFDNVHVRRAVAFAIDRERWSKARNYALHPTGQLLPPSVAGFDPNLPNQQRFDLAQAKQEMRLGGFPNGLAEPVTLWGGDSASMRAYGELLQSDLSKIGIKLNFKFVNFPVYLEETGKRKRAQIMYGGWIMDFPDPSNFLGVLSSSTKSDTNSYNRAFYSDPWLDKQLDDALVERDPLKRVAMYREANDFVAREAPWAFFANQQVPQAWQPYVRGYRPHPAYWIPVTEVWLDLPRRPAPHIAEGKAALGLGGAFSWMSLP